MVLLSALVAGALATGPIEPARAAVEADPLDLVAQERYLDALIEAGCETAAETHARRHLAADPDDPDRWVLLGRAVLHREESRLLHEEALRLRPDHARAWSGLGRYHIHRGDGADARLAFTRAVLVDPSLGEAWTGLVESTRSLGRREEALELAREAAHSAPDTVEPLLVAAELAPAQAWAARALPRFADDPRVHLAEATRLLFLGDGAGASAAVERAASLDPMTPGLDRARMLTRCVVGATLDGPGYAAHLRATAQAFSDPGGAGRRFAELTARHPGCAATWMGRAATVRALGDDEAAVAYLKRATQLAPGERAVQIAWGHAQYDAGRPRAAREWLGRALVARPEDAELAVEVAGALVAADEPAQARLLLASAWAASPADPSVALAYAVMRRDAGDPDGALFVLIETLTLLPWQDALVRVATPLATELGRLDELHALADLPVAPPLPALSVRTEDVDEQIEVVGESEVERRRQALARRLASIGYGQGTEREGRTVFRPDRPIMPVVTVFDDGGLEVQESGYVKMPDGTPRSISARKMAPRRKRVIEAIWPEMTQLREAVAAAGFQRRLDTEIPDALDALWTDGVPLDGGSAPLVTPEDRRQALLDHWATRACTPEGDQVRAVVEEFFAWEVQVSEWPVTTEEVDQANERCRCDRVLVLPR